jgi:hypothetical protein
MSHCADDRLGAVWLRSVSVNCAVMSALRPQHWLSLVTAIVALGAPISSTHAQQGLPPFFGIVSGIINSAIADSARREWQSRPVSDYNCLGSHNLSADQLVANGIGPNDPRIRPLLYQCAHARKTPPERIEPQTLATSLAVGGPHNPNFVVDGLALGGVVYPGSAVYKDYTCEPSHDFAGFTWCARYRERSGKIGPYASRVAILHSAGNRVVFITQSIAPAFFAPGDVDREIARISKGFGQAATILTADAKPDFSHAILATWGTVTLTPLDEAAMDALHRGEVIHRGLIAEFIGDADKSARIGLPVYSIGGGPGYIWGASFDDAGKGSLRISAVDASALGSTQPAPAVEAPSPPTVSSSTPPTRSAPPLAVAPSPTTPAPEVVLAPPPEQPQPASQLPPVAPPPKAMDVIDFLVDWKSLIGQTVTVTGCSLQQAGDTIVVCSAGSQGTFFIDGNTLAREDLRRALRECAGFEKGDECRVDVTGNATEGVLGGPELTNAAMKWAPTLAAPQPPQSVSPYQPTPPPIAENSGAMPTAEKSVIDAVEQARRDYASASNEMQEGAARPTRARAICAALPDRQARRWIGNVSEVSSNSEGRGVLYIKISSGVQVTTWNNALSDTGDNTLIEPSSSVYRQALSLTIGQGVIFSGQFLRSAVDCIRESSLTLHGSVSEPDFIIRFLQVTPLAPSDSACSAVAGPDERLTCFYKNGLTSVEPSAQPVTPSNALAPD